MATMPLFLKLFREAYPFKDIKDARLYLHGNIRAILDYWLSDPTSLQMLARLNNYLVCRKLKVGRYEIIACVTSTLDPSTTVQLTTLIINEFVDLKTSPQLLTQRSKYAFYAFPYTTPSPFSKDENI